MEKFPAFFNLAATCITYMGIQTTNLTQEIHHWHCCSTWRCNQGNAMLRWNKGSVRSSNILKSYVGRLQFGSYHLCLPEAQHSALNSVQGEPHLGTSVISRGMECQVLVRGGLVVSWQIEWPGSKGNPKAEDLPLSTFIHFRPCYYFYIQLTLCNLRLYKGW